MRVNLLGMNYLSFILYTSVSCCLLLKYTSGHESAPQGDGTTNSCVCPKGWVSMNSGSHLICYNLFEEKVNFDTGKDVCKQNCATMATITDGDQQKFIYSYLTEDKHLPLGDDEAVWVGGQRLGRTNKFLWNNGVAFQYTQWGEGQPDNYWEHNQNCIRLTMSKSNLVKWDDIECRQEYSVLCQIVI